MNYYNLSIKGERPGYGQYKTVYKPQLHGMNVMYSVNLEKGKSMSAFLVGNNPCWDWVLDWRFHVYGAFNFMLTNMPCILNITPSFHEALENTLLALFSPQVIGSPYR